MQRYRPHQTVRIGFEQCVRKVYTGWIVCVMPITADGQGLKNLVTLAQALTCEYAGMAGRINEELCLNALCSRIVDGYAAAFSLIYVSYRLSFDNMNACLARMLKQDLVKGGTPGLESPTVLIRAIVAGSWLGRAPTHAVTSHTEKTGLFDLLPNTQKIENRENAGSQRLSDLVAWEVSLLNKSDPIPKAGKLLRNRSPGGAPAGNNNVC